jgi:uncharacterized protein HemY
MFRRIIHIFRVIIDYVRLFVMLVTVTFIVIVTLNTVLTIHRWYSKGTEVREWGNLVQRERERQRKSKALENRQITEGRQFQAEKFYQHLREHQSKDNELDILRRSILFHKYLL